jgi:hypothetical protein
MRLQGWYVDAITLHGEMLAGWVVVLGAQQFSDMTHAGDLGVDGFHNRKPLGLYCIWCQVSGNDIFFPILFRVLSVET